MNLDIRKLLLLLLLLIAALPAWTRLTTRTETCQKVIESLTPEQQAQNPQISFGTIDQNTFVVMVDPTPTANWKHKVKHYFLPREIEGDETYIISVEDHDLPPETYMSVMPNYGRDPNWNSYVDINVPKRDVPLASHQYAVILSGGINHYSNHPRYWNDCSYIYKVLRNHFNVPKANIYVSMADGTTSTGSLDLDGDTIQDVNYAATLNDLGEIFSDLREKLTEDDHLFLFVIDHGGRDENLNMSTICLWGSESLYPDKLNSWFNDLSAGSINCVFGQCFSGGFIEPLRGENRIIATACNENEPSWANSNLDFDAFVNAWTTALLNVSEYNGKEVLMADTDGDNYINMQEAFYFAFDNDEYGINSVSNMAIEHPMFDATNDDLVKELCFDRFPSAIDLFICDDDYDLGIEPNVYPYTHNSPDIWVRRTNDGKTAHQDPLFTTEAQIENYVYVKVHNKGIKDYVPTEGRRYLHLNWATGGAAHNFKTYAGTFRDGTSNVYGGAIQSILIDKEIPAGGEETFCIPWKTRGYTTELESDATFSILATISDRPYGFTSDMYIKKWPAINYESMDVKPNLYKRMAIKSINTPNQLNKTEWSAPISIQSLANTRTFYYFQLESGNGVSIYDILKTSFILPKGFYQIYSPGSTSIPESDRPAQRVVYNPESEVTFESYDHFIKYFGLNENQNVKLTLHSEIINPNFSGNIILNLILKEYPTDRIVGHYTYLCSVNRGKFTGRTLRIAAKTDSENITLYAEDNEGQDCRTSYEWINESGELIGTGRSLSLSADMTPSILVKATTDDETITSIINLSDYVKIAGIERDGSRVQVDLNLPASKDMMLLLSSALEAKKSIEIPLREGDKSVIINIPEEREELLVISLFKNGKMLESKKIK